IGTCAPTEAELRGVRCHLIELVEPGEPFTVADWTERARRVIQELEGRGALAVVVGGTGLYVNSLLEGFDFGSAPPDPARRRELSTTAESPEGLLALVAELGRRDPEAAARIDLRNPRRVIRALEIRDARD